MTNYHIKAIIPPSVAAQDAKAKRAKVIEAARKREQEAYRRMKARQRAAYQSNEEYKEYQEQLQEESTL